jgi:hypothetical protein
MCKLTTASSAHSESFTNFHNLSMAQNMMQNQDVDGKTDQVPPIRKANFIEKLCFVVTGEGLEKAGDGLKRKLQDYRSSTADESVSRVGINNWFDKNAPGKGKAYQFLQRFLQEAVDYNVLSAERKKVFNQMQHFIKEISINFDVGRSGQSDGRSVLLTGLGGLMLQPSKLDAKDYADISESWSGFYITFRRRLIVSKEMPYARELVRIFKTNKGMGYRHWHLRDGVALSSFEGGVLISRDTLWFVGVDQGNSRFRFCHFKRNETLNPDLQRMRWGLMHSDIPIGSSKDPASTKILMRKCEVTKNVERFAASTVRYLDQNLDDDPDRSIIEMAIENGIKPDSEGRATAGEVLRTNHIMLESILRR